MAGPNASRRAHAPLVAAFAPQVHVLIAARLFQALGGCAGLVLGRTIVRDTAAPSEAARRLALMNLMITAGPSRPCTHSSPRHLSSS